MQSKTFPYTGVKPRPSTNLNGHDIPLIFMLWVQHSSVTGMVELPTVSCKFWAVDMKKYSKILCNARCVVCCSRLFRYLLHISSFCLVCWDSYSVTNRAFVSPIEMKSSIVELHPSFFGGNNLSQEGKTISIFLQLSVIEELCVHLVIDWKTKQQHALGKIRYLWTAALSVLSRC